MTGYWGAELASKAAAFYHADADLEMHPVISDRCGGNPFYIAAVVKQAAKTGTTIPGRFFNSPTDVVTPSMFMFIHHRYRCSSGKGREIDVLGASDAGVWVCQSKWVKGKPSGVADLDALAAQAEYVREDLKPNRIWMWLFSHDGLTQPARAAAAERGVLWSSRRELDDLLSYVGLRALPEL